MESNSPTSARSRERQTGRSGHTGRLAGLAQLSLVEHALCPLDPAVSLTPGLVFSSRYRYSDLNKRRQTAQVRVGATDGVSAYDEFYLWGLLALALGQDEARPEFVATPYYCLRRLGLITGDKRGGREFDLFRQAIRRIAGVRYENDAFYDPVRGEHRQVSFGFLNYSLPLDSDSARAWRFAWDPIFFEFAQATGGALRFDVSLYREFDPATRRLYLFLKKLFWRRRETGFLDLRHLAVDVLGFSPDLEPRHLKQKLCRCLETLLDRKLITLPEGTDSVKELFVKQGKGRYAVRLYRGPDFHRSAGGTVDALDSPLADPLRSIGFDAGMIRKLVSRYPAALLEQWADITLAARERHGETFFTNSPQAYFLDNVKAAAAKKRTPPDWWRELRKQEREREREQSRAKAALFDEAAFERYLETEAREAFAQLTERLVRDLTAGGQSDDEARAHAERMARRHLRNQYERSSSSGNAA